MFTRDLSTDLELAHYQLTQWADHHNTERTITELSVTLEPFHLDLEKFLRQMRRLLKAGNVDRARKLLGVLDAQQPSTALVIMTVMLPYVGWLVVSVAVIVAAAVCAS